MKQISVTALALLALVPIADAASFNTGTGRADSAKPSEFSAQSRPPELRPRIEMRPPAAYPYPRPEPYAWPGPGYVRRCVDWYATEYRPSGKVITPQMRCRWVRGY